MNTTKTPGLVLVILIGIGLYLAYLIVILIINCFVYSGYNFLFFADNLFKISFFNPIVSWAFAGLLIGSIVGVLIAVKKYQLSKKLVLFPAGLVMLFFALMYLVNKPTDYAGNFDVVLPNSNSQDNAVQHDYYTSSKKLNARSGPSTKFRTLFVINSGYEVELMERNIWDKNHNEWFKIKYNNKEGYVNSKYLHFSRSY